MTPTLFKRLFRGTICHRARACDVRKARRRKSKPSPRQYGESTKDSESVSYVSHNDSPTEVSALDAVPLPLTVAQSGDTVVCLPVTKAQLSSSSDTPHLTSAAQKPTVTGFGSVLPRCISRLPTIVEEGGSSAICGVDGVDPSNSASSRKAVAACRGSCESEDLDDLDSRAIFDAQTESPAAASKSELQEMDGSSATEAASCNGGSCLQHQQSNGAPCGAQRSVKAPAAAKTTWDWAPIRTFGSLTQTEYACTCTSVASSNGQSRRNVVPGDEGTSGNRRKRSPRVKFEQALVGLLTSSASTQYDTERPERPRRRRPDRSVSLVSRGRSSSAPPPVRPVSVTSGVACALRTSDIASNLSNSVKPSQLSSSSLIPRTFAVAEVNRSNDHDPSRKRQRSLIKPQMQPNRISTPWFEVLNPCSAGDTKSNNCGSRSAEVEQSKKSPKSKFASRKLVKRKLKVKRAPQPQQSPQLMPTALDEYADEGLCAFPEGCSEENTSNSTIEKIPTSPLLPPPPPLEPPLTSPPQPPPQLVQSPPQIKPPPNYPIDSRANDGCGSYACCCCCCCCNYVCAAPAAAVVYNCCCNHNNRNCTRCCQCSCCGCNYSYCSCCHQQPKMPQRQPLINRWQRQPVVNRPQRYMNPHSAAQFPAEPWHWVPEGGAVSASAAYASATSAAQATDIDTKEFEVTRMIAEAQRLCREAAEIRRFIKQPQSQPQQQPSNSANVKQFPPRVRSSRTKSTSTKLSELLRRLSRAPPVAAESTRSEQGSSDLALLSSSQSFEQQEAGSFRNGRPSGLVPDSDRTAELTIDSSGDTVDRYCYGNEDCPS